MGRSNASEVLRGTLRPKNPTSRVTLTLPLTRQILQTWILIQMPHWSSLQTKINYSTKKGKIQCCSMVLGSRQLWAFSYVLASWCISEPVAQRGILQQQFRSVERMQRNTCWCQSSAIMKIQTFPRCNLVNLEFDHTVTLLVVLLSQFSVFHSLLPFTS